MNKYTESEIKELNEVAVDYDNDNWNDFDNGIESVDFILDEDDFDDFTEYLYIRGIEPLENALSKVKELDFDEEEDKDIAEALWLLEDAQGTQDWVLYNDAEYTVDTPEHFYISEGIREILKRYI